MRYQLNDSNLKTYNKFFNDAGKAFVLKPENLRWIPIELPNPIPQNPANNYAARTITGEFVSYQI